MEKLRDQNKRSIGMVEKELRESKREYIFMTYYMLDKTLRAVIWLLKYNFKCYIDMAESLAS